MTELRPASPADASALAAAYVRNRDHLRPWEPHRPESFFTEAGQKERLLDAAAPRWLLTEGELVIGQATLSGVARGPFCSASLGYWIDGAHTGRGLATRLVEEVCRAAREELGLHRVEAGTVLANTASQRVLAKAGFTEIGVAPRYLHIDGAWRDHRLFQRILHDGPPTA
ncbi:GNAT family N-acetyltransferase [Streptomyces sp. TLI_146]|uniref:GNAT family N-acetyltransferase n=1 Tax=Streptomyces sp. TLI_146 TaxID=1938858 RepID=UPI000C6FE9BC|nr:GNAT family protein [Streptomyces sp. TLI_146]PKV86004.1 ribosomal-protein-alanine N-acetyltransferase [Streptomyces sp. TLI_146]